MECATATRSDRNEDNPVPEQSRFVSRQRAGAYIGRAAGTLANWAVKGIGPRFYKTETGAILYDIVELDEWVRSGGPRRSTSEDGMSV